MSYPKHVILFLFAFLLNYSIATAQKAGAPEFLNGNAASITAAQLSDYLHFIASDELEGRDTPSRGLNTAAKFIATLLSRWGYSPAGDNGTYFQGIDLNLTKVDPEKSFAEIDGVRFKYGDDFLARSNPGTAEGQLVYAGNGYVFDEKKIDSFGRLSVKDHIVIYSDGMPTGLSRRDLFGKKEGEEWFGPMSFAEKNGAQGLVMLPTFEGLSSYEQSRNRLDRGSLVVTKFKQEEKRSLPVIIPSPKMIAPLFKGEQIKASEVFGFGIAGQPVKSFALDADKKIRFEIYTTSTPLKSQNVVAVLEGSDPVLKNEYVAIGSHYDHVGVGSVVAGDSIFNGADDDGSGTVAMLAMAEAFAKGPRPKRSLLFVWHTGEEKGLLGSKYFVEYPTIPLEKIVAHVNIDMIGRSRAPNDSDLRNEPLSNSDEIFVIGSKMMSTELGKVVEETNNAYLKINLNYQYDDPMDSNRFFFRSDHYNYAKKGIPIVFYFSGTHVDYHQRGDSADKIDYVKMERVTRTIHATAWNLANRPVRPKVDKVLPKELSIR